MGLHHGRMSETLRRALRLLALLQLRSVWTGPELAQELGVPVRCVRRDVQRLRELGYPVNSERGRGGGYRLGTGQRLPPLLLEPDEAVAVGVGLRLASASGLTGLDEAVTRAFARLDQLVQPSLKDRIGRLASALEVVRGGPDTDLEILVTLTGAVQHRHQVRIDYVTRDGRTGQRRIEPYRVVCLGAKWYLFAWDLDREDWRTFRLDRIQAGRATTFVFAPRQTPDIQEHLRRAVSTDPYRFHAAIRFLAPVEQVRQRLPPDLGLLAAESETTCVLTTGADDLHAMAVHLACLDLPFEVQDPPELAEALRWMGERLLAAGRLSRSPDRSGG